MIQENKSAAQSMHAVSLGKRMLFGAALGLLIIAFFLFGVKSPNPDWGKYWMVRPLIVVPIAGAFAGVFYYFMDFLRYQGGWKKIAATVLGVLVYIIGLWLGTVLGLAGTLWN